MVAQSQQNSPEAKHRENRTNCVESHPRAANGAYCFVQKPYNLSNQPDTQETASELMMDFAAERNK